MNETDSELNYLGPERRRDIRPLLPRRGQNRRKADANRRLLESTVIWVIVLFSLYALSGYFIIPSIINNLLPKLVSDDTIQVAFGRSSLGLCALTL